MPEVESLNQLQVLDVFIYEEIGADRLIGHLPAPCQNSDWLLPGIGAIAVDSINLPVTVVKDLMLQFLLKAS